MNLNQNNTKELFQQFINHWDEDSKNSIWENHKLKFYTFWKDRILKTKSNNLNDNEVDSIIKILDSKGKGNTKIDSSIAHAMIPQGARNKMFKEVKANKEYSKLINEIFNADNDDLKGILINKLYILNEGKKNYLTGQSGNAINTLLAGFNPFINLSIVSFKDRLMLMKYLDIPFNEYYNFSIGKKLAYSNSNIIQEFENLGIFKNARVISDFVYSPLFKNKWKNIEIEDSGGNYIDNLEFCLQKLNEEMKKIKPIKRKSLVEQIIRSNRKIVELLKKSTNNKCQFPNCTSVIQTKSGINYTEVAHIEPVHRGGQSVLGNLIVLCPNHHKEFDYGNLEIKEQSENILRGNLNGYIFSIDQKRNYIPRFVSSQTTKQKGL